MKKSLPVQPTYRLKVPKTGTSATAKSYRFYSKSLMAAAFFLLGFSAFAQQAADDGAYQKVIKSRSEKIVNTLGLQDSAAYMNTVYHIMTHYAEVNRIHDAFKQASAKLKLESSLGAAVISEKTKALEDQKSRELTFQHSLFLKGLNINLDTAQISKVKDGLTYNVLNVTYGAYTRMLLQLTPEEKKQIYAWLLEARELAVDAPSSDAKHAVFGKYKGRINNYLSARGYDIKKETEEWLKREKAAKGVSN